MNTPLPAVGVPAPGFIAIVAVDQALLPVVVKVREVVVPVELIASSTRSSAGSIQVGAPSRGH
jgi:hypothetical protein